MDVTIQLDGDRTVVVARGVLDVHTAPDFREAVVPLLAAAGPGSVLDTSALHVADLAGDATLQWLARHRQEFGGSELGGGPPDP
ncbi:STAS domain-containing protein [Cellulomonas sp. URHE0023]|uniref:STAS domain-containing protein n=1 Tax=Cellulomonas sp. URHE0023 TaxID=1380354 RepID=UPI0004857A34|nr:STAS domain-containing protein [Cellulomonas sp. URHE0023]